jgi:hypothetical protein
VIIRQRRRLCARARACADLATPADPLHTFFSLGGLALCGYPGLEPVCPATALRADRLRVD